MHFTVLLSFPHSYNKSTLLSFFCFNISVYAVHKIITKITWFLTILQMVINTIVYRDMSVIWHVKNRDAIQVVPNGTKFWELNSWTESCVRNMSSEKHVWHQSLSSVSMAIMMSCDIEVWPSELVNMVIAWVKARRKWITCQIRQTEVTLKTDRQIDR